VPQPEIDERATVTLRLPPSAAHVRTARLVAAAMARRSGVGEDFLDEVRLAVGEACARAVRRHNRHDVAEPVTVEFLDRDRFSVTVIDAAPGYGPESATGRDGSSTKPADLAGVDLDAWTDPTAEALGLALLGAIVHDMTVADLPGGNGSRLTMSWPLEPLP
jgi:anti-sigma regulatory factor (Ser/Thr protein kinase)